MYDEEQIYLDRGINIEYIISFKKTAGSGHSTRKGEVSLVDFA